MSASWVEFEYDRAIARAIEREDNDLAYDLSVGRKEFREFYAIHASRGKDES